MVTWVEVIEEKRKLSPALPAMPTGSNAFRRTLTIPVDDFLDLVAQWSDSPPPEESSNLGTWRGTELHVTTHRKAADVCMLPVEGTHGQPPLPWTVWELSGGGSKTLRLSCDGGILTLEELPDAKGSRPARF